MTICFGRFDSEISDLKKTHTNVGNFINDTRHGLGTAYYQDGGPKYIGSWINGNPEGSNGTLFLQNGQKYVGSFQQGKEF